MKKIKYNYVLLLLGVFCFSLFGKQNSLAELRKKAIKGETKAQKELAMNYFMGQNAKRNYTLAVHWFRQAAENGDIKAKYF